MSAKTYVLDTSVLLAAGAQALRAFEEHEVVLPLVVITELEGKRNDPEIGWIARQVLNALESLRLEAEADGRSLTAPIRVNGQGGTVRIETNHVDRSGLPDALRRASSHDVRILAVACGLQADERTAADDRFHQEGVEEAPRQVIVVSRDLPMRLLAGGVLGLTAEDYRNDQAADDGYTGVVEVHQHSSTIDALYGFGFLDSDELECNSNFSRDMGQCDTKHAFCPQQFVDQADGWGIAAGHSLEDECANTGLVIRSGSQSALAIWDGNRVNLLQDQQAFGMKPRSAEQRFALAHLLDPEIGIVSLGGRAGTGKSALALAAGLECVIERRTHKKIIVFRPMYSVGGQDLGFLPGTEDEKMSSWGAAVQDALESICEPQTLKEIMARGQIEVLPLTHIRGRTLTGAFIIIDEAQNLERPVLLSALSRLGPGSKVVLTHDVAQRDNLHVGRHDGIATVVDKLRGQALFAHVTLTRSERSPIAEMVTRLLDGE